jgi:iron complex transport system ATP-binding protein
MKIATDGVSVRYPGAHEPALTDVSVEVRAGESVAVVGPNGSGKTTLLRVLVGVLPPTEGRVLIDDGPIVARSRRELARLIGVVPQREDQLFPLKVEEAVLFGRYPHLSALGLPTAADRAAVGAALVRCDVAHLVGRRIATLSGGEWQRVRVARALAQEPRLLVLDEATTNLDIRHEMEVFELVTDLVRTQGIGAVIVTHQVNLAARFADRVIVMDQGQVRGAGAPADVLSEAVLEQVFRWPVAMTQWDGAPQLVPLRQPSANRTANGRITEEKGM